LNNTKSSVALRRSGMRRGLLAGIVLLCHSVRHNLLEAK
jgi:hypothetical protein